MIRVEAPAKINWFLEITGKRPDGYHSLSTLFQTISLADTLTFTPAARLTLHCSEPSLPTDETNLVMRAARRLQETLGVTRGARMTLRKRIPMGAGLGGGSSDAAAALLALPRLWKRRVSTNDVERIAVGLGADVPFFLRKGLCQAKGIGEKLEAQPPLRKTWMVLTYPGFGVATREAYARVRLPWKTPRRLVLGRFMSDHEKGGSMGVHLFNRFEELVFPDHPALPKIKQAMIAAGASTALMSGSGSSVFGIVPSLGAGRRALKVLSREYPQSWLVHTL